MYSFELDKINGRNIVITEVKDTVVLLKKSVIVFYVDWNTGIKNALQYIYNTEEQRKALLETFKPTKVGFIFFDNQLAYKTWLDENNGKYIVKEVINGVNYIHIQYKEI